MKIRYLSWWGAVTNKRVAKEISLVEIQWGEYYNREEAKDHSDWTVVAQ
jgi:hypothetical protein